VRNRSAGVLLLDVTILVSCAKAGNLQCERLLKLVSSTAGNSSEIIHQQ